MLTSVDQSREKTRLSKVKKEEESLRELAILRIHFYGVL